MIREGKPWIIEAKFLVPSDVVVLEIGRIVPADGIIVAADSLFINEAMLTGESVLGRARMLSPTNLIRRLADEI